jgi:hypothetical protein
MTSQSRPLQNKTRRNGTNGRSSQFRDGGEPKLTRFLKEGSPDWQPEKIIEKLNDKPDLPGVKRVARFIELFKQAREINDAFPLLFESRDAMGKFLSSPPKGAHGYLPTLAPFADIPTHREWNDRTRFRVDRSIFPGVHNYIQRLKQVRAELDRATARYKWYPRIWASGYGHLDFWIGIGWKARNAHEHWENYSIWFLCSRKNGELFEYFRRCRECDKWYFAATVHQIYCGDNCRKRSASRSETFRNARREYMRNYRHQEKSREAAAKNA